MGNLDLLNSKWEQYATKLPEWLESFTVNKLGGIDTSRDIQTINGILAAMVSVVKIYFAEAEFEKGKETGDKALEYIDETIKVLTGGTFEILEDYSQMNKIENDPYLNLHYEVLLAEAPYYVDSFKLYIEKDRCRKDRFYEPRRKTLKKVSDAIQRLENDELDILFIHMPPRTGKSGDVTMDVAWHCARDTELSNLYVTYKEGLGGAFLDGVQEIYTDPTYRFADVFPKVKITATDAKNNKLDLGTDSRRKKKYKSLSGKGLESGLNGEYDATGWLVVDDPLEGVQDVMSKDVLHRKQEIFDNNVLSRKKEKCKLLLIGTCWSVNDIFANYLDFIELNHGKLRHEVIRIPALDPDTDESNFDYDYGVGFSTEYYQMQRSKHEMNDDMAGWLAQYQQQPIEREGAVFNPEHMHYYDELPGEEPVKIIAHCDVALGGNDFLSFPIVYYFENPDGSLTGYVEDVVFDRSEKHVTQPLVCQKIIKHQIKNVHFESNQGGEGYKDDIKRMLGEKKYRCNISSDWAPVTKRKEQRIWDCAQDIRELYYKSPARRDDQYRKFMQNLFSFTMNMKKRDHDDAPDSLAGLVDFANNGSGVTTVRIMPSLF